MFYCLSFYFDVQHVLQKSLIMHCYRPPLPARGGVVSLSWLPVQLAGPPLPSHYIMSLSLSLCLCLSPLSVSPSHSISPSHSLASSLLLIHSQKNPLCICLPARLSASPPFCQSVSLSVCLSVICLSVCVSLPVSVSPSIPVCLSLSTCPSVSPCLAD